MKRLTKNLKHVLSAMAAADAGEMLTRHAKTRHLGVRVDPASTHAAHSLPDKAVSPKRRQVALWLGETPATYAIDYAVTTCQRMDMDLVVLHTASVDIPRQLGLSGETLAATGLQLEAHPMLGNPVKALLRYLSHTPRIAFVVIGGTDHELHELTDGLAQKRHHHRHPVPMVVVTPPHAGDMDTEARQSRAV